MAEERTLADRLFDYGVYAPIGIALSVVEELPKLAEKGRQRAAGQVHLARVMGRLAVRQAQRHLNKQFKPATQTAPKAAGPHHEAAQTREPATTESVPRAPLQPQSSNLKGSRDSPIESEAAGTRGAGSPPDAVPTRQAAIASDTARPTAHEPAESPKAPPRAAESLAIPGYDTLAASQVVQRLGSLSAVELDAIARYEMGTRGRRTILHRIGQLRADR